MAPLIPNRNQSRLLAIRAEAGHDDAEALARLFEDPAVADDGTLPGRLRALLDATERWFIPGLHTGLPFRDVGFAGDRSRGGPGFRDPWEISRNQVGHFLTAVGLGFRPSMVSGRVLGLPLRVWLGADPALDDETVARRLTVGHELAPDPGVWLGAAAGATAAGLAALLAVRGRGLAPALAAAVGAAAGAAGQQGLGFRRQFHAATADDERVFLRALAALATGPTPADGLAAAEAALAPLFARVNVNARGNSHQDLRLSLLGWALGAAVRDGTLTRGPDAAAWLRARLKPS